MPVAVLSWLSDRRGHVTQVVESQDDVTPICYPAPHDAPIPEWFSASEAATEEVMKRIAASIRDLPMAQQVRSAPMLAHWFLLDTLLLANRANRDGMHANALALTRQCVEAIGIIELGVCGHMDAEAILTAWDADRLTPGKLRAWLESNVWAHYGSGLWTEPWSAFTREFARALLSA